MQIDAWLTAPCEIDFVGATLESLTAMTNYCAQNKIAYKAKVDATPDGMKWQLTATATNESAYVMIRDYKNRGGN